METLNSTSSPTAQGLDATQGDNSTFNAFMVAIAEIDKSTLFDNSQDTSDTVCLLLSVIPSEMDLSNSLQLSWTWQYCSQFGFYQVADPNNPVNIESTYNTIAAQQTWCDQTFNNMDPRQPNVTTVDQYGGWNMSPSNVFFSNGQCRSLIGPPSRTHSVLTRSVFRRPMEDVEHQQPGVQLSSKEW